VVVQDTTAPNGSITAPEAGICTSSPVTIQHDFGDRCDPSMTTIFTPGPGPTFGAHGDHDVTVRVTDGSGNYAEDSVSFTVDTNPPTVEFAPRPERLLLPLERPFTDFFSANDADGASGGIVREVLYIDDCIVYDGDTYGDGDGLLSDESLTPQAAVLCRAAEVCGQNRWSDPVVTVTASDCGGNVGVATHTIRASLMASPAMCSR
jgi:hypothetical protein